MLFAFGNMSNEDMPRCSKKLQAEMSKSIGYKAIPPNRALMNGTFSNGHKSKIACLKNDLQCPCQKQSLENYQSLKKILPENYDYRICSFSPDGEGFKAVLRLPYLSPEKAQQWKTRLQDVSYCIFRVCRTFPGSGRYNIFKIDYACQHNTGRGIGKLTSKKTGCKAELSLTVKRVVKKSRSRDRHLPEYPTSIFIRWCHNHPLDTGESLRYRDVGEETVMEFVALYHRGYSPASAYTAFRWSLMKRWGRHFDTNSKDRQILPEKQYVYRLFAKLKKKKAELGTPSTSSVDPILDAMCRKTMMDVILPAAGNSTRMGGAGPPKPFIKVMGTHIIAYTINCFHRVPWVRHIVLVVGADRVESTKNLVQSYGFTKVLVCEGSHTRHRSIFCGLQALKKECKDSSVVIIHDGARPFVAEDIIEKIALAAEKHGAAGVVRPLVSTVIKGNEKGMLETALKRSDYGNSEMPQGFQYGVITGAYEKCNKEEFDYGTECLLLALKYSQCAAELLEGNDYLWKVTYQKDISLMETTIKVKFTRLSFIQKSSQPLKCMESLQSSLQEKGLTIVSSENEGANTIICFLDPPTSLPDATAKGRIYANEFENLYARLPNSVTKLNLMVVAVFVRTARLEQVAGKSLQVSTVNSLSVSAVSSSSHILTPTSQLPSHQRREQPPQDALRSHQDLPHLHHHYYHHHHEQQRHYDHTLSADALETTSFSCTSCPQNPQHSQPFASTCPYQYSRNIDSSSDNHYSFGDRNPQAFIGSQPGLLYPPPHPPPPAQSNSLSHLLLPNPQHPPPGGLPSSTATAIRVALSPHQPFNICQEISFSDLQSPQNIFESNINHSQDNSSVRNPKVLCSGIRREESETLELPPCTASSSRGVEFDDAIASDGGNAETDWMELKINHKFLGSVAEKMKIKEIPFCLVGVVCEDDEDVNEKLLDLVWGRNQFLNGQLLSFISH